MCILKQLLLRLASIGRQQRFILGASLWCRLLLRLLRLLLRVMAWYLHGSGMSTRVPGRRSGACLVRCLTRVCSHCSIALLLLNLLLWLGCSIGL